MTDLVSLVYLIVGAYIFIWLVKTGNLKKILKGLGLADPKKKPKDTGYLSDYPATDVGYHEMEIKKKECIKKFMDGFYTVKYVKKELGIDDSEMLTLIESYLKKT